MELTAVTQQVERVNVRLDGAPTHFYKNLLAYCQSKKKPT